MLFRSADDVETRRLTMIGAAVLAIIVVTAALVWLNPLRNASPEVVSLVVDTPFVGQGVAAGTPVVLHGVPVGAVTSVSSSLRGGIRLGIDVDKAPTSGLTDTFRMDFRPANYFGVTGINLIAGRGGQPLRPGSVLTIVPSGNYTLQALLSRLGDVSGVISPRMVETINTATDYLDALNPLIETMLIVAKSVTSVQTVSTDRLLANGTGIAVASPSFLDAALKTADTFRTSMGYLGDDQYYENIVLPGTARAGQKFYAKVGNLLSSHQFDLTPMTDIAKSLADVIPGLVPPAEIAGTAQELRTRLERMYAGSPEQRALQVQIVLDSVPGVAAFTAPPEPQSQSGPAR